VAFFSIVALIDGENMITSRNVFFASLTLLFAALFIERSKTESASSEVLEDKPIVIGAVFAKTGSEATYGSESLAGLSIAIDEVNAAGGINGRPVVIEAFDTQSKIEEAAAAASKLASDSSVFAVVGDITSAKTLAMAPIVQRAGLPLVSPGATLPKVTSVGDYIFRVCFIDDFQGEVMAKFAMKTLKLSRVAVMSDVKNDYSVGLSEYFIKTVQQLGGSVVAQQSYQAGDVDFRSQLTALRALRPEVIFIPGFYTEVSLIARQARDLGLKVPLLGGDGWDSPRLLEIGRKALNNSFFSNHFIAEGNPNPLVGPFIEAYAKLSNKAPSAPVALGYDSGAILIDAMKRAQPLTRQTIRDALASTKDLAGLTGRISMDEHRNAMKEALIVEIKDGAYKIAKVIALE
jgi:branched-chain amino acid transport system substrate-binding protein